MKNNWIYILVAFAVIYAIRVLPLTLIRKPLRSRFLRSFLYYVPYVTLAVMTFPAIVEATEVPAAGAAALAAGIIVALLGGSRGQIFRKVIFPASLPWLLASLRTGLGLSLSGAVVGEYLGASKGLGWAISSAGDRYDTTQVLCYVLVIVALVVALDAVLRAVEKRVLRWQ